MVMLLHRDNFIYRQNSQDGSSIILFYVELSS